MTWINYKNGKWYKFLETKKIELGEEIKNKEEITNVFKYLEDLDVLFPAISGKMEKMEAYKAYLN